MDSEFANVVRVLAVADEQSLIRFCEESGTIDDILGFRHSHDIGDSIIFVRFKRLSSIYDLKRRSKVSKIGGRSVLVETVADSRLLQEQCRRICKIPNLPDGCLSYCGDRMGTPPKKENRRFSFPNYPLSTPTGRFTSAELWRFSGPRPDPVRLQSSPLKLLNLEEAAASRPSSHRTATADESVISTTGGLLSPLARSPTNFKDSLKPEKSLAPRASAFSPQLLGASGNASRRSRLTLLKRTLSSPRKTGSASTRHFVQGSPSTRSARSKLGSFYPSELRRLKEELCEAKEKYARSLEKVQSYLDQMEKKYSDQRV